MIKMSRMRIRCQGSNGSPPEEYGHVHKDGWVYVHDVGEGEFARLQKYFKKVEILEWGNIARPHRIAERERIEEMMK